MTVAAIKWTPFRQQDIHVGNTQQVLEWDLTPLAGWSHSYNYDQKADMEMEQVDTKSTKSKGQICYYTECSY